MIRFIILYIIISTYKYTVHRSGDILSSCWTLNPPLNCIFNFIYCTSNDIIELEFIRTKTPGKFGLINETGTQ